MLVLHQSREISMTEDAVPSSARLVRDFVNSYEPQIDGESWGSSDALKDWLIQQRLVPSDTAVADSDLATAVALREGVRNVLLGHAGHDPDPGAIDALRAVLAELPVRVDFDTDDYRLVSLRNDPVGRAFGQLLDAVRQSSQGGTWHRLKVCARDSCRWAFYDASRNQTRRWCSMAGCGNHIKMRRAYTARKTRAAVTTGTVNHPAPS
jgi:predicted RNA-binding Zn ribbon-like protein